jgi:hypothetical protein
MRYVNAVRQVLHAEANELAVGKPRCGAPVGTIEYMAETSNLLTRHQRPMLAEAFYADGLSWTSLLTCPLAWSSWGGP